MLLRQRIDRFEKHLRIAAGAERASGISKRPVLAPVEVIAERVPHESQQCTRLLDELARGMHFGSERLRLPELRVRGGYLLHEGVLQAAGLRASARPCGAVLVDCVCAGSPCLAGYAISRSTLEARVQ